MISHVQSDPRHSETHSKPLPCHIVALLAPQSNIGKRHTNLLVSATQVYLNFNLAEKECNRSLSHAHPFPVVSREAYQFFPASKKSIHNLDKCNTHHPHSVPEANSLLAPGGSSISPPSLFHCSIFKKSPATPLGAKLDTPLPSSFFGLYSAFPCRGLTPALA